MTKQELFALIGGERCRWCSSTERVEFDHIYREGKEFNLDRHGYKADAKGIREALKCQPLCQRCHIIKTALEVCPRPINLPARQTAAREYAREYNRKWQARNSEMLAANKAERRAATALRQERQQQEKQAAADRMKAWFIQEVQREEARVAELVKQLQAARQA